MLAVKKALKARAVANAPLVAKLGGAYIYQEDEEADTEALIQAGAQGIITFACPADIEDPDLPFIDQSYRVTIDAKTSTLADEIAELISDTYRWRQDVPGSGTLPALVGRRLANVITVEAGSRDIPRDAPPAPFHRRIRSVRVATYAT